MAIIFIFLISVLVGTSQQCTDLVGVVKCKDILRTKNNFCAALSTSELALCEKTCGVCKPEAPVANKPPAWAFVTPGVKRRNDIDIEKPVGNKSSDNLALPLYAVIIIIVAVLVIFIGVTVCIIKLKKKWKKRKMKKNIRLLRNATPAVNTIPREYLWGTNNYSDRYHTEMNTMDVWARNMHVPDKNETWQHQHSLPMNNTMALQQQQNYETGGYNTTLNRAKDKRKAPNPPAESPYQNLQTTNAVNKICNSRKPAAPSPPILSNNLVKNENRENIEIPIEYSESLFSEAECVKNNAVEDNVDHDSSSDSSASLSTTKQSSHHVIDIQNNVESKASTVDMAKTLSELSGDEPAGPALTSILNDWKEHLQEQKKELEDYYKSLANYVQKLGLQAVEQEKHRNGKKKENNKRYNDVSEAHYVSIPEKYKAMKFPEPPESVMGDQPFEPNNIESQNQVINNLKKRIDKLQYLLESAQEEKSSPRKQVTDKERHYNNIYFTEERKNTIKNLLKELETKDRLKVQMRIAQALDAANKRGIMTITAQDGPITCLLKQVHHVITDILDPRTGTKIELGAHASFNLANKLLMYVHTNLLPVVQDEKVRKIVAKTADRISHLTKQMLDMTKQFNARQMSYQSKDYSIFVNAFVDTNEKIIDTTYQLVSIIRQLQQAERRSIQSKRSLTIPSSRPSAQSSFHLHQQQQQELLHHHQQRSDVLQQQEVVRHPHPHTLPNMSSQNNYFQKRLPSDSNSSSLSATDIRRLNHDLARLRQLLNTGCKLEPLSETTTSNTVEPYKQGCSHSIFSDQLDSTIHGSCSDSDTLSETSCSTCMPDQSEPFFNNAKILDPNFYNKEDFTATKNQNMFSPEPKESKLDILAESHRPPRRPQKSQMISKTLSNHSKPNTEKALDTLDMEQQDEVPILRKVSTLDPSSFTSFHSEQEQKSIAQPRHQAMLARYFGGEVLNPKTDISASTQPTTDKNEKTLNQPKDFPVLPITPFDSDAPEMTVLSCGLIAKDTPPIKKPSKKIDLSHIPEITVLRNGTEQPQREYETANKTDVAELVKEEHEARESNEKPNEESYLANDNLDKVNENKVAPNEKEVIVCSSSESSSHIGDSIDISPDYPHEEPDTIHSFSKNEDDNNDTGTELNEKQQSWTSCDQDTIETKTNGQEPDEVFDDLKAAVSLEKAYSPDISSGELRAKKMLDSEHESESNASTDKMLGDADWDKIGAVNVDSCSYTSERSDTPSSITAVYDEIQKI